MARPFPAESTCRRCTPPLIPVGSEIWTVTGTGVASVGALKASAQSPASAELLPSGDARSQAAFQIRAAAARVDCVSAGATPINNGDEAAIPGFAGCFTKGLPHDQLGLVDSNAY